MNCQSEYDNAELFYVCIVFSLAKSAPSCQTDHRYGKHTSAENTNSQTNLSIFEKIPHDKTNYKNSRMARAVSRKHSFKLNY